MAASRIAGQAGKEDEIRRTFRKKDMPYKMQIHRYFSGTRRMFLHVADVLGFFTAKNRKNEESIYKIMSHRHRRNLH